MIKVNRYKIKTYNSIIIFKGRKENMSVTRVCQKIGLTYTFPFWTDFEIQALAKLGVKVQILGPTMKVYHHSVPAGL